MASDVLVGSFAGPRSGTTVGARPARRRGCGVVGRVVETDVDAKRIVWVGKFCRAVQAGDLS